MSTTASAGEAKPVSSAPAKAAPQVQVAAPSRREFLYYIWGASMGESLKYEDGVGNAMRDAAVESKATVVAESFHEFKPWGVSGAVVIQESHYTIHTWPEHGYAAVDLFYCGGTVDVHKAVDVLMERFNPGRIKFLVVRRGRQDEVDKR